MTQQVKQQAWGDESPGEGRPLGLVGSNPPHLVIGAQNSLWSGFTICKVKVVREYLDIL